ncbi:TetR family transcriptional regulator [Kitasatospora herbaricolor]|uniref:TetR/AcrR family transcriptional regulator n=1 Tax=Kitasatospora herbaricolor TaxID=68217 RepID=UPI0017494F3C|nr:TetR/AcrR family transcriptional regulator [Kitasatospora herbaricolor]MDQ0311836.1 AcrR family transcriptional regulator [Kitasatospora herbaricolor]GGU96710.1 TetR family transcriptional regulator [Kitasatospora herbaricolor]
MPRKPDIAQQLLDSALSLFAERTYEGTQMPAVAQRAGVGVGSIYRYFPSKEALGNAAFQYAKRGLLDQLNDALVEGGPVHTVREEFGRFWLGFTRYAGSAHDAFVFLEHQQHDTFLAPESQALAAEVDRVASDFIERGQRSGEIRDGDPQQLVALAIGAFTGLVKHLRPGGIGKLSPASLKVAEDAVWDLLHRKADS